MDKTCVAVWKKEAEVGENQAAVRLRYQHTETLGNPVKQISQKTLAMRTRVLEEIATGSLERGRDDRIESKLDSVKEYEGEEAAGLEALSRRDRSERSAARSGRG